MKISSLKNILFPSPSLADKILKDASVFPRYKEHSFNFRNYTIQVTDFLSVAWQLKEFFDDGRMKFKSTATPIIYDCGANIGISILYYKELYPKSSITAFEADPKIFNFLEKNISNNNIQGVELINKAVWISNEGVEFSFDGADGGSVFSDGNKISIPSIRLKELLAMESRIDLLKIDIEGAELEVLKDCASELKKVNYLFVEYHSWKKKPQQLDKLLGILKDNGFRYYIHSIGEVLKQPFVEQKFSNDIDVQLDIHAINEHFKK